MNAAEDKNGLGSVFDLAAGLLKNPAVIEGILTGISALTASQRVKNPKPKDGGFDLGGIFEMLPQILPLLGLFKNSFGDTVTSGDSVPTFAEVSDDAVPEEDIEIPEDGSENEISVSAEPYNNTDVSYGNKKEQRENLILAIRPFLSESRVAAADAMLEINRISGIFKA